MNKKLVLLLAAIFLTGAAGIDVPAMAVSGPFGYDLQKDIHRNKNKEKEQKKNAEQNADKNKAAEPVNTNVTDDDIFVSSIAFNKAYYPNASMKSAVIKYKKGNYTGSLQELYTLVKKNPNNALAYYYVLTDNPSLPENAQKLMYGKAVSAYWKMIRKTRKFPWFSSAFVRYLRCKISPQLPNLSALEKMKGDFLALDGVRRVVNPLNSLE